MTPKEKLNLITRNTEEVLGKDDLARFINSGEPLKHYIGFEISGKVHLGQGIMAMAKIKDFMDAGVETNIFLADWHTWMNDKLGGNLELIKEFALGYFAEALKAGFLCVGGEPAKLNFILGSEFYHNNDKYWQTMVEVARHTTRSRINRSISILGRKEGGSGDFAKLLYPVMQVADIFGMGINLTHAGTDQRKAHVIARHVATLLKIDPLKDKSGKIIKPVAIHHHLLLGLSKPNVWPIPKGKKRDMFESMKMSKSKPGSAIFIHDSADEIKEKIINAFCPPKEIDFNPIMDWAKHIIFSRDNPPAGGELRIPRAQKYGGPVKFTDYEELEKVYVDGKLHPEDLKLGVADWLVAFLEPARKHFAEPKPKEMLKKLEQVIKS